MKKIITISFLFFALLLNAQGWNVAPQSGSSNCDCDNIAFLDAQIIKLNPSDTKDITIVGGYFDTSSMVAGSGFTVNSVSFISHDTLIANVTSSATEALYNIEVSNECGDQDFADYFEVKTSTWIDLRAGSGDNPTITTRAGLTTTRDAQGIYFGGTSSGWGNWVQFPDATVTRGGQTRWGFVFTKTANSNFMCGVGNDAFNTTNNAQYTQQEWMLYSYSNRVWGYYGNNGTLGGTQNQAANTVINFGTTYKVIFDSDGESGQNINVYEETDGDWDTNETLVSTSSVVSINTADEINLIPTIVPNTLGTQYRIVAYIVE